MRAMNWLTEWPNGAGSPYLAAAMFGLKWVPLAALVQLLVAVVPAFNS